MAYLFNLPNTTAGPDLMISGLTSTLPLLPVVILMTVFFLVLIIGIVGQSRKQGYVDMALWVTFSFLVTDFSALLMSLGGGIINPLVLGVCFGGTILSGLWLFLSRGRFETA